MGILDEIEHHKQSFTGNDSDLWTDTLEADSVLFGERLSTDEVAVARPKSNNDEPLISVADQLAKMMGVGKYSQNESDDEETEAPRFSKSHLELMAKLRMQRTILKMDLKTEPVKILVSKVLEWAGKTENAQSVRSKKYDEKLNDFKDIIYQIYLSDLSEKNKMGKLKLPGDKEFISEWYLSRMQEMAGENFENVGALIDAGIQKVKSLMNKNTQ